jgi:hypothetical protein
LRDRGGAEGSGCSLSPIEFPEISVNFEGVFRRAASWTLHFLSDGLTVLLAALVSGSRSYLQQVFAVHFIDVVNDLGIRARHRF